jgi:hypothetical protein
MTNITKTSALSFKTAADESAYVSGLQSKVASLPEGQEKEAAFSELVKYMFAQDAQ